MGSLIVIAPIGAELRPLAEVPDPVFAEQMLGPGIAMMASGRDLATVIAPVAGRVAVLRPHAFFIEVAPDITVLVHLGLDTYSLEPSPFAALVAENDQVHQGQPMIKWDLAATLDAGIAPWVALTAMGADDRLQILCTVPLVVDTGAPLLELSGF